MIFYPKKEFVQINLSDYTLILPSVSVGNVGQLAVDLLISTLPSVKIGIVHHAALYPLVGSDPYNADSTEVVTSADLHVVREHSMVLMQIRSPLIKKERQTFLKEMLSWCKDVAIKNIIILASCNAFERWEHSQIMGSQLRYLTTLAEDREALRSLGAVELEEREDEYGQKHRFLSGAGYVEHLMKMR
ncbi:Proteasome assembly chaperone 2 [Halocaridina rubra]|uniref:Proteasome assembly chaperone 2 n=1 Tax=Halocaridina rubra TaxID=373956 RepID=A0AAN8XF43_HALRR